MSVFMKVVGRLWVLLVFLPAMLHAQTGMIEGRALDSETKKAIFGAQVQIVQDGNVVKQRLIMDPSGYFSIRGIAPGTYRIRIIPPMAEEPRWERVVVIEPDKVVNLGTIYVRPKGQQLGPVEITGQRVEQTDYTSDRRTISSAEIQAVSTRNAQDLVATAGGVFQRDEGEQVNIRAARGSGSVTYVDGVPFIGRAGFALPKSAIEQVSVLLSGLPAKYGDATGGAVNITTKGFTKVPVYSIELVTSQFLDPYGYNLASGFVSAPLMFTKTEGDQGEREPILGIFASVEYTFQKDPRPVFFAYKIKDSVYQEVTKNPLIRHPERGFIKRVETLGMEAFEPVKARPNVQRHSLSFSNKLTYRYKGTDFLRIDLGVFGSYSWGRDYVHRYSLMNYDRHPYRSILEMGTYLTVYQDFSDRPGGQQQQAGGGEGSGEGVLRNFSYRLVLSYSLRRDKTMDWYHRDRIFDYGYIGRFETYRQPIYAFGQDSATGMFGYVFYGWQDTLTTFEPGGKNPLLEQLTQQFYDLAPEPPRSIWDLYNQPGIVNGERTFSDFVSHSIWFIPGRQYGAISKSSSDRFRVWFNAGFDLFFKESRETEQEKQKFGGLERGRHTIEFGFEYRQDVSRFWQIFAPVLWTYMRQYMNKHLQELNTRDPILIIDGKRYRWSEYQQMPIDERPIFDPLSDTIYYEPYYNARLQEWFDIQVRKKLGLPVDGLDFIQIDTLPPDFFSLDMFTPDELFLSGDNPLVFYYGYDYLGKKLSRKYTFRDFWNARDANGNLYRPVPAFRPVYMAFYVQDKFRFRDLIFNIGLRVDRYDANQKVLKDKYLLLPAKTVSEVPGSMNPNGQHPATVGPDYVVYVDDARNPRMIVGYRKGDRWYDANGNEIKDPGALAALTTTGTIQPYLVDPEITEKDTAFDPSLVFEDYKPAWTIMPRIAFSFPISDVANFFAHYDVLAQRPREAVISSPYYWYFLREIAVDQPLPNPGLRPEKVIDYSVGFRQRLGKFLFMKITGFYREFRDMIQATRVEYAYPITYMTFSNLDFGTAKGLTFSLEMRRLPTLNLMGSITYTLQFAKGTGSNYTSQLGLIRFGEPNLRTIVPLDYDQRHTVSAILDYRIPKGKGPRVKIRGKRVPILSEFGANLYVIAGSGTPFTMLSVPLREAQMGVQQRSGIRGGINQARMPWTLRMDLKLRKDFVLVLKSKKEGEEKSGGRRIRGQVYVNIFNLLNRRNVIRVWRYTGSPVDDGFLSSSLGQEFLAQQAYPDALRDQYMLYVQHPFNFSRPRRIHLGVMFRF